MSSFPLIRGTSARVTIVLSSSDIGGKPAQGATSLAGSALVVTRVLVVAKAPAGLPTSRDFVFVPDTIPLFRVSVAAASARTRLRQK